MVDLPEPIEDELDRIHDGPTELWAERLEDLRRAHPDRSDAIAAAAAARQRLLQAEGAHAGSAGGEPAMPPRLGPYHVLSVVGHGGMGTVYLAERRQPMRQRVAVKVVKLGMDTAAVLARFEVERQALALMTHDHIAKVLDAGATPDGRPYFAMEYVEGVPITRYCDQHRLSVDERLVLFQQVCAGVQHAHTKGVVHRDLTSNNVLVTVEGGHASAKIIDFGLAKAIDHVLTERTQFTERGVILGTPEYMSPEQAGLSELDVDTRTDVYSLGVLLYHLLTGLLPFDAEELRAGGYDRIREIIRERDPQKPSTKITTVVGSQQEAAALRRTDTTGLVRRLRGDLDWIVMKCLEKDRTRRYQTAEALADDIGRHLGSEPVSARAPSLGYRLHKLAARHRGALLAAAAVLLSLVAGLAAALYYMFEERARADERDALAKRLERKIDEFEMLSVDVRLRELLAAEKDLYPARPEQASAMGEWLRRAQTLAGMRSPIERTLEALRSRQAPTTPAAPAAAPGGGDAEVFLVRALDQIRRDLDGFAGVVSGVEERKEWAEKVQELSIARHADRWAKARADLQSADGKVASRLYAAVPIDLAPQLGLVPLGTNPATLLLEFYHLGSAADPTAIPALDARGHIPVDGDTGIVFVLVPGGTFTMGAQSKDPGAPGYDWQADASEAQPHAVQLAPFFIARHEITQGQWRRLSRGGTPSLYQAGLKLRDDYVVTAVHPVEQITWDDADRVLSQHGLVLPTESQWEYACRAGTSGPWWTGSERESLRAGGPAVNVADQSAGRAGLNWPAIADWPEYDDGFPVHAPVDALRANPFGLHHVLGNVEEWVRDAAAPYKRPLLPSGERDSKTPDVKVYRGGSFGTSTAAARCSARNNGGRNELRVVLGARAGRAIE